MVLGDPTLIQPTVDFGYMTTPVPRGQLQWIEAPDQQQAVRAPSTTRNEVPPVDDHRTESHPAIPQPRGTSVGASPPQVRHEEPAPPWAHDLEDNGDGDDAVLADGTKPSDLPPEVVEARRAILALRLGQVLEENVEHLSVGLDSIHSTLLRSVEEAVGRRPQSLLFEGSWGTGKTHLLTLLTALARQRGMATAHVILDGEGVTLAEPMGILKGVLASLRYPDEAVPSGLAARLRQVRIEQLPEAIRGRLGRHIGWALLEIPRSAYDDPEVIDILHDFFSLALPKTRAMEALSHLGYYTNLPAIGAWMVRERPRRFRELLSRWAEFCVMTGATGLTVVFDELDVEYAQTMYRRDRQDRRRQVLRVLEDLSSWRCPLVIAFGSAPLAGFDHESYDAADDVARHVGGLIRVRPPTLTTDDIWNLVDKLQAVYETAYGEETGDVTLQVGDLAAALADELNPTPRRFVRGLLEILDLTALDDRPEARD